MSALSRTSPSGELSAYSTLTSEGKNFVIADVWFFCAFKEKEKFRLFLNNKEVNYNNRQNNIIISHFRIFGRNKKKKNWIKCEVRL